jgi:hypothetical protein
VTHGWNRVGAVRVISSMRSVLLAAIATVGLAASARSADAGDCSGGGPDILRDIEAYARGKLKEAPSPSSLCMYQEIVGEPKSTKRFLAACEKIVVAHPTDWACVRWAPELGVKKLGTFDLFDGVHATFKIDPFEYGNTAGNLYILLDDPRAVPLMREAWKTANADKRATMDRRQDKHNFIVFRHSVIKLMAKHGSKDDAAFLAEQAKTISDKGIKRAITKAIAAIDKRSAPATP